MESVEGHAPQARCHRQKYATECGLHGMPSCVNNVETLAWVPAILYHGGETFRDCGVNGHCGMKLFCVSGHVAQPTLGEFPMGTTLRQVLAECAPEIPEDDIAAVEVGGAVERLYMGGSALDRPLCLSNAPDVLPGGGSIVVFRRSFNFNAASAYQAKAKMAHKESCQLCAPCRDGTKLFRQHVKRIIDDPRSVSDSEAHSWLALYKSMETLSNCGHGKACGGMARKVLEERVIYGRDHTRKPDPTHFAPHHPFVAAAPVATPPPTTPPTPPAPVSSSCAAAASDLADCVSPEGKGDKKA